MFSAHNSVKGDAFMTEIVVIGDEHDTALGRLIKETLSMTYRVLYIKGNCFSDSGSGYELVVHDCPSPRLDGLRSPVIVAKRNASLPCSLPDGCTAIVNADRHDQLDAVQRSGAFAVECGISPTSTVSFSSESDDTVVISLNRSLRALSGREIQPLEIPVTKNGSDIYTLMSFTALRLLLDDFESELGRLI